MSGKLMGRSRDGSSGAYRTPYKWRMEMECGTEYQRIECRTRKVKEPSASAVFEAV